MHEFLEFYWNTRSSGWASHCQVHGKGKMTSQQVLILSLTEMMGLQEMCISRISSYLQVQGFRMTGKRFLKDQDVKTLPLLFLFCLCCSFDCFCQSIVCLPFGLIYLPSWIPLYFSLLKRVFYTRGNISSGKTLLDIKPAYFDFWITLRSCFTHSLWTVALFCSFYFLFSF